uniref:EOG090X091L n=1 Tax=Daphnia similis TaxID=35528 RepID=A0A4Y7MZS9_9CRUS|nr:EOG090X091L [Daphnia similis]SVE86857.1 EOG090X091L [Daphnia similis]SVE87483.1 EOG090X091L [Daphnia similis]SVE88111.1 EOG090X091L [Daphnia similis]
MYRFLSSKIIAPSIWSRGLNFPAVVPSSSFHEIRKSGYEDKNRKKVSPRQAIRDGLKELKQEIKIWTEEVKEGYTFDPIMGMPLPGEVDIQWSFNESTDFDNWVVTSDSDHDEGHSTSTLSVSPTGKGLFSGNLSTQLVRDGKVKRAGYCNFKSIRPQKSFKRDSFHDWNGYTHLVMRVRGDGRSYMITLGTAGYFDVNWNDQFHFALYTRGGPHWQISKIPFSKFYMTSKGRIQDAQEPVPLNRITSFGITACDKNNGPFRLEIDYVGLERDPSHKETSAYEQYKVPYFYADNFNLRMGTPGLVNSQSRLMRPVVNLNYIPNNFNNQTGYGYVQQYSAAGVSYRYSILSMNYITPEPV